MIGGQNGYIVAGRGRGYFETMFAAGLQLADFALRMVGIFPGGPVVKIQSFYFMGHTFVLHAAGHVKKKKKMLVVFLSLI